MYKCLQCRHISSSDEWNEATIREFGELIENIEVTENNSYICPNCTNIGRYPGTIVKISKQFRLGDEVEFTIGSKRKSKVGRIIKIGGGVFTIEVLNNERIERFIVRSDVITKVREVK